MIRFRIVGWIAVLWLLGSAPAFAQAELAPADPNNPIQVLGCRLANRVHDLERLYLLHSWDDRKDKGVEYCVGQAYSSEYHYVSVHVCVYKDKYRAEEQFSIYWGQAGKAATYVLDFGDQAFTADDRYTYVRKDNVLVFINVSFKEPWKDPDDASKKPDDAPELSQQEKQKQRFDARVEISRLFAGHVFALIEADPKLTAPR